MIKNKRQELLDRTWRKMNFGVAELVDGNSLGEKIEKKTLELRI